MLSLHSTNGRRLILRTITTLSYRPIYSLLVTFFLLLYLSSFLFMLSIFSSFLPLLQPLPSYPQLSAEKEKNKERDADLPVVPGGSLGSFKNGLQSLPLRVRHPCLRIAMHCLNRDTACTLLSVYMTVHEIVFFFFYSPRSYCKTDLTYDSMNYTLSFSQFFTTYCDSFSTISLLSLYLLLVSLSQLQCTIIDNFPTLPSGQGDNGR